MLRRSFFHAAACKPCTCMLTSPATLPPALPQRLAMQDPSRPPLHGLARALSMPNAAAQRRSPPIPQFGARQAAPNAAPQGGWLAQEQLRLLPRAPLPQQRPQFTAEVEPFAANHQLDVLAGPLDSDPPLLRCGLACWGAAHSWMALVATGGLNTCLPGCSFFPALLRHSRCMAALHFLPCLTAATPAWRRCCLACRCRRPRHPFRTLRPRAACCQT